ncbi:MAG: hypothetical protein QXE01_03910 [Sulfolobales archaeon]
MSQTMVAAASAVVLAVFAISMVSFLIASGSSVLAAAYYMSRLSREQLSGSVYQLDLYSYAIYIANSGAEPLKARSSFFEISFGCQGGSGYYRTKVDLGSWSLASGERLYRTIRFSGYDLNAIKTVENTCASLGRAMQIDGAFVVISESGATYRFPIEKAGMAIAITAEDLDAGVTTKVLPNGRQITIYTRMVLACFASPSGYPYYSYYPSSQEAPISVDIYFGDSRGNLVDMPFLGGRWPSNIRLTISQWDSYISARCTNAVLKNDYQEIKYVVQGQRNAPWYLYSGVFLGVAIVAESIGPGLRIDRIDTGLTSPPADPSVAETYTAYLRANWQGDPVPPIAWMFTPEFLLKLQGKKTIFQSFSGIILVGQIYIDQLSSLGYERKVTMSVKLPIIIYLSSEAAP